MSFSGDVKKELSGQISGARHCQIAELAALMRFCADVRYDAEGNGRITFRSDHERVVRKYRLLLNRLFKVRSEIYRDESGKRALYCLDTAEPETVRKILRAVGEGNAAGFPSAENARGGQDKKLKAQIANLIHERIIMNRQSAINDKQETQKCLISQ